MLERAVAWDSQQEQQQLGSGASQGFEDRQAEHAAEGGATEDPKMVSASQTLDIDLFTQLELGFALM